MHRLARPCLLLLTAAALLLTQAGCGMSEEDKDFFVHGWIRPTDLDKQTTYDARRRAAADAAMPPSQSAAPAPQAAPSREPVPAIEFQ